MSLFFCEWKKIWNWRVVGLLFTFAALMWFLVLKVDVQNYKTLMTSAHYQREMFEKYGTTLEVEELDEYDIPGKMTAVEEELDNQISSDMLFTNHGIHTYKEYQTFMANGMDGMDEQAAERFFKLASQMDEQLWSNETRKGSQKLLVPPVGRLEMLAELQNRYAHYEQSSALHGLTRENQNHPVAAEAIRKIQSKHNNSLVPTALQGSVSRYASVVGVSAILMTILIVSPSLTRDRARNVYLLQYSSAAGRRILWIQLAAAVSSACIFSLVVIAVSAIPLLAAGMGDYFGVSMLFTSYSSLVFLYEITFAQYVLLLAGMIILLCAAAACFTFVLARFSTNIMNTILKIVPLGLAFWILYLGAISDTFTPFNMLFSSVLHGRMVMPELILCVVLAVVGVLTVVSILVRERKTDVSS
ncbi:hypothetical protein B9G55_12040 [Saccharibacillus sp. O16]|nr:hypothetical protein B9G55_12040 [Saccharibacillus sp. O16]